MESILNELREIKDLLKALVENQSVAKAVAKKKKSVDGLVESPGSRAWSIFDQHYFSRYGIHPTRNAKTNGQCAHLVKRVPEAEIEDLCAFYLKSNDAFYLRMAHNLSFLLRDCETLLTLMKTGIVMNSSKARQIETTSNNLNVSKEFLEKKYGRKIEL